MRSVQLMRSTTVSEPLYSMTVPLKVISLLNMATTKFPFSRELEWPSDNAGTTHRQMLTTHLTANPKHHKCETFNPRMFGKKERLWECLLDAIFIIRDCVGNGSEAASLLFCTVIVQGRYVETLVVLNCSYLELDCVTPLNSWYYNANRGAPPPVNTNNHINMQIACGNTWMDSHSWQSPI